MTVNPRFVPSLIKRVEYLSVWPSPPGKPIPSRLLPCCVINTGRGYFTSKGGIDNRDNRLCRPDIFTIKFQTSLLNVDFSAGLVTQDDKPKNKAHRIVRQEVEFIFYR